MKDEEKYEGNLPRDASKSPLSINVFMALKKPHKTCLQTFKIKTVSNNKRGVLTACQISPNGSIYYKSTVWYFSNDQNQQQCSIQARYQHALT